MLEVSFMRKAIPLLVFFALFVSHSWVLAESPKLSNTSGYLGKKNWEWKVFIDADERELKAIESVDYILPGQINPKRLETRKDSVDKFALRGSSWGTFKVLAIITYKDKRRSKELYEYQLIFERTAGKTVQIRNWARKIPKTDRVDWGIWIDEKEDVLREIDHVEYTLHPTFRNPIREESNPDTQFEHKTNGWGTFQISIIVFFKDGTTHKTKHMLRFQGVPTSRTLTSERWGE